MSSWVGMKPLRVQALITKIQTERAKISELEGRIASVQNNLSWEILSKSEIEDTLQRARNKIRKRAELLEKLEGLMRESVDDFKVTDQRRTEAKGALEYLSTMVGTGAIATGISSLAMSAGDTLWNKIGSVFGTGSNFVSSVEINEYLFNTRMESNPMALPVETELGTPAPADMENGGKDKLLSGMVNGVFSGVNGVVGNINGFIRNYKEQKEQEIAEARERGLSGEKPTDLQLFLISPKAYNEQLQAWKSTLSPDELAAYEASLEEAEEKEKSRWEKFLDTAGGVAGNAMEFVSDTAEDISYNWNYLCEDVKEWKDDVVADINDFTEEHPSAKYAFDVGKDFVGYMGKSVSAVGSYVSGDYLGAASAFYDSVDCAFELGQDSAALAYHGLGYAFENWIGADEDNYQDFYDKAQYNNQLGGFDGEVGKINEKAGEFLTNVEKVNDIYSGFTGIVSGFEDISKAKNVGEVLSPFFSWNAKNEGGLSTYKQVFGNTGTVMKVIEGAVDNGSVGIISEIIAPIGDLVGITEANYYFDHVNDPKIEQVGGTDSSGE